MKKLVYLLMIVAVGFSIYALISYSNSKHIEEEFYTLPEGRGYVIREDRMMEFDIYSNNKSSLISHTDMNSYKLITDDININLDEVSVKSAEIPGATLYTIKAKVPDITDSELTSNCYLEIENSSYKVKIDVGVISFLKPKGYELLDFEALSASGSYLNGHLNIVGFNMRLKNQFKLINSLRCGEFAYARLNEVIDSELEPIVNIKKLIPTYDPLKITLGEGEAYESMFIPISYKRLLQLKETYIILKLDDKDYYIDTFFFDSGTLDFLEYKDIMIKGELNYA